MEEKHIGTALRLTVLLSLPMWIVYGLEYALDTKFMMLAIKVRSIDNIGGILGSALLHGDFDHILQNTAAFMILTMILFTTYPKKSFQTLAIIWLGSGLLLWSFGIQSGYHLGASGVVYGLASHLFFMGLFRKDLGSAAVSLLIIFLYGSFIWGLFPIKEGISWDGHLAGAVAGLITSLLYYGVDSPPEKRKLTDDPDYPELPYWEYYIEGELKEIYKKSTFN